VEYNTLIYIDKHCNVYLFLATPRAEAFVGPPETPRTEPLFRCSGPPTSRKIGPLDLPAIVSRQNTEDHLHNTLHNRPKTFSTPPTTTQTRQCAATDESSESTTSSHGHHSTCSNPVNIKPLPAASESKDKGCISDPSTRQERKSAFTRPPPPQNQNKKMVIDVGHYEKYARDKNGNIVPNIPNGKSFPPVTPSSMDHSKIITHTRRLVNLVYPSYGTTASSKTAGTRRSHHVAAGTGARTSRHGGLQQSDRMPGDHRGGMATMMTREKTTGTLGTPRLTGLVRNSLDNAFTTTKLRTDQEDDQLMELKLGGGGGGPRTARAAGDSHKVALPLLSPPSPRKH
jgi:hypothetical protein